MNARRGINYRATEAVRLYASAGRSFEAPTLIDMAYRNAGSGLNSDLKPAFSNHYEVGTEALIGAGTRVDASLFMIHAKGEIVVDTTLGGRTIHKNAGSTRRQGIESSVDSDLGHGFYVGMENRPSSKIHARDINTAHADSYRLSDLGLGVNRRLDRFSVQLFTPQEQHVR